MINKCFAILSILAVTASSAEPLSISGIYPSLAYFNGEGECGTGAVAPWGDSLWVVTYGPHCPTGGTDRLYRIASDLTISACPESVGGTHASRMAHRESGQLFIGTYLVSTNGRVRTVPIHTMPGRLTGAARHLTDPANKIYVTDMEEALYELDVNTLKTRTLIRDGFNKVHFDALFAKLGVEPPKGWKEAEDSELFGYHGKGTCSGFGKVFYSNNGFFNERAMKDPTVPAGALAEWSPEDRQWHLIRTNQFTEVTTQDGIYGNEHPTSNPIWAMGWDAKSVILTVTTNGTDWCDYRLPKGSHSYDGAHGWNTEWPRIREIGGEDLLATMHGTFWRFPKDFAPGRATGIRPRANYLKVIGDFCSWRGRAVFGCDDSARDEFMNKRAAKGTLKGPARSQSNLWFVEEPAIDAISPAIGNATLYRREDVKAGEISDPLLFAGYRHKWMWVAKGSFAVEVDRLGDGRWMRVDEVGVGGTDLSSFEGEWMRVRALADAEATTVALCFRQQDERTEASEKVGRTIPLGPGEKPLLHVNAAVPGKLGVAVSGEKGYALTPELHLESIPSNVVRQIRAAAPLSCDVLAYEPSSILYIDDNGNRFRLPYGTEVRTVPAGGRICREVCTERDHFNAGGIYYELPAENAHGFFGVRPVATHNLPICDYVSWRGLFVMALPGELDLMAVDDLWRLGKVRGFGGPWKGDLVCADVPSDPYLMNGFDRKRVVLSADRKTTIRLEVDVDGWGTWVEAGAYELTPGTERIIDLPLAFGGYWIRSVATADCVVSVQLVYE